MATKEEGSGEERQSLMKGEEVPKSSADDKKDGTR